METTMVNILNNNIEGKYEEIVKINELLGKEKDLIIDIINNIKKEYLYKSKIHGFNHSVKVMLFAYLIAKSESLNEIDTKIIIDAALYHDIGRQSDNEDTIHGLSSAFLIDNTDIIKHRIYQENPDNLSILKAIMDGHSRLDKEFMNTALNNDVQDIERYRKLYNILKDADALDRKRFREGYNFSLNPKFLRTERSKELIKLSEEINDIYKKELQEIVPQIQEEKLEKDCIHSIGFDFFKLPTILKYGILSKSKLNELNIKIPRNFEGGNLDNWISVVDGDLIKNNYTGMKCFVSNGISFYCTTNHLVKGLDKGLQNQALENGLPYNKGLHEDEKYVYKQIPTSNILSIIIPENYKNVDISKLNYIFNSLSINHFKSKIDYYYNKISELVSVDYSKIIAPLQQYEFYLDYYHNLNEEKKEKLTPELPKILETPRQEINGVIQQWMKTYYSYKLNRSMDENINVVDVVKKELQECDINCNFLDTDREVLIFLDNNANINTAKLSKTKK